MFFISKDIIHLWIQKWIVHGNEQIATGMYKLSDCKFD